MVTGIAPVKTQSENTPLDSACISQT
jgi:hypothetical protein